MKILVSAGHSTVPPKDSGATGNGYEEANETLKIRDSVAAKLRAMGKDVVEDGADGRNDPLKKAIALAHTVQRAVEFHFNAGPPDASGIEVLCHPVNKGLAQKLAAACHAATGIPIRGELGFKAENSGHHSRLGFVDAGGLIVEVAFITSKSDMEAYVKNFDAMTTNLAHVLAS